MPTRATVLACLWTTLDHRSPLPAFVEMCGVLATHGLDLTLVTVQEPAMPTDRLSVRTIPSRLGEFGRATFTHGQAAPAALDLSEFEALDWVWWGESADDAEGLAAGLAAWDEVLDAVQPCAVLAWGTTFPHSRAAIRAAQRRSVPVFVLERGHVVGTLMASPFGQGPLAPPGCDPWFGDACAAAPVERWGGIVGPLKGRVFAQPRFGHQAIPLPERRRRWRILFVGSFDLGAGIGFEARGAGEPYVHGLTSSLEAARLLIDATRRSGIDADVVVRPHPFDTAVYETLVADDVILAPRAPIDDLFPQVDVVVGLTSTANAGAFVYERPLLTLSATEFDGLDVCWRVRDWEELAVALLAVTSDTTRRDALVARGRRVFLALLETHLMQWGDGSLPVRHTVRDFAAWLARFAGVNASAHP